jgi:hypothetical protein
MCRFCLSPESDEKALFALDLQMSILEMGNGEKVTISDALNFINLDLAIPNEESRLNNESADDSELDEDLLVDRSKEHPDLPKSLCQECLDKLQSIYEFKYRVIENREYLKNYLKEMEEAKFAEEKRARQAIAEELDIDLNNLDSLPDKLVLKANLKRTRRPKVRDPNEPPKPRKKRTTVDKTIIIAEDSQVDNAIYVRKLITTPEKAEPQAHSSKRKSKHVVIEDIPVAEKQKAQAQPRYDKFTRKKEPLWDENNRNESNNSETDLNALEEALETTTTTISKPQKVERADDDMIFEDDDDYVEDTKRSKRTRK